MKTLEMLEVELSKIEDRIDDIYNGIGNYSDLPKLEHKATCLECDIKYVHRSHIEPCYLSNSL